MIHYQRQVAQAHRIACGFVVSAHTLSLCYAGLAPENSRKVVQRAFDSVGIIWFHRMLVSRHVAAASRLFDNVVRRKGNADGGVLASPFSIAPRGERSGRTRLWRYCVYRHPCACEFFKSLRATEMSGLVKSTQRPPEEIPPGLCQIKIIKLESLILAQNERWRQA